MQIIWSLSYTTYYTIWKRVLNHLTTSRGVGVIFIKSKLKVLLKICQQIIQGCGEMPDGSAQTHSEPPTWIRPSWCFEVQLLTHQGRVTHICVSKQNTIVSDNGLSHGRCQAIIEANAGIVLFDPLGTNFSEISIEIHIFYSRKCWRLQETNDVWNAVTSCNV